MIAEGVFANLSGVDRHWREQNIASVLCFLKARGGTVF